MPRQHFNTCITTFTTAWFCVSASPRTPGLAATCSSTRTTTRAGGAVCNAGPRRFAGVIRRSGSRVAFLGRTVLVPDPVEHYLKENYGDWRRPDPFHVAAFSAPNLIGGYGAMPRCAAYRAICLALFDGDRRRAAHLAREVARRDPADTFVAAISG